MDIFGNNDAIRNRMLADATHRMKNMLGGIGGFAALLKKDIEEDDPCSQLVDRIRESVIRLDEFIVDFMALLRNQSVEMENIDLPSTFREACNQHFESDEDTLVESPIKVVFDHPRIQMKANPILLRKCLYHAVRFLALISSDYGKVQVESKRGEPIHIRLEFESDCGLKPLLKNPVDHIDKIESIDARISFLLCLKLSQAHGGQTQLEQKSNTRWALHIYLRKDFKNE